MQRRVSEMSSETSSLSGTKQFVTAHRGYVISSFQNDDLPPPTPTSPDRKVSVFSVSSTSGPVRISTLCQFHDYVGVGQVQYLIWVLSVVLSYANTAELLSLSLLMPYLRCTWKLSVLFEGMLCLVLFISYSVISDSVWWAVRTTGRRSLLITSGIIIILSIITSSVANNMWVFILTRAFIGCSVGVSMTTLRQYTEEFTPRSRLPLVTVLLHVGAFLAALLITVQGMLLLNIIGWRLYLIIHTVPHFLGLVLLLYTPESLELLLEKREMEKLNRTLQRIANRNDITLEGIEVSIRRMPNFRHHYGKDTIRNMVALAAYLFGNTCTEIGVFYLFPILLTSHFCNAQFHHTHSHDHMCMINLHNFYKIVLLVVLGGVAIVTAMLTTGKIPAALHLQLSTLVVLGMWVPLFYCTDSYFALIPPLVMKFSQQVGSTACWTSFPEFFPLAIRREAELITNVVGKLGSVLGSSLVFILFYSNPFGTLAVFIAIQAVSFCACFALYKCN